MTAVLDTRCQIHTSRRGLHNIPLRGRGGPSQPLHSGFREALQAFPYIDAN
jgi:hypothetical protein